MPVSISGSGPITGVTSINTTVSDTELGYLDGVTSAIQPQINTAGGLVLVAAQSFTTASSISVNNCFTATYDFYRILWDAVNPSGSYDISMRLRSGGSDNSSSIYGRQSLYFFGTNLGTDYNDTQNAWFSTSNHDTSGGAAVLDVFNPAASSVTRMNVVSGRNGSAKVGAFLAGSYAADGFTIFPTSGSLTGTLRVYGYRNS